MKHSGNKPEAPAGSRKASPTPGTRTALRAAASPGLVGRRYGTGAALQQPSQAQTAPTPMTPVSNSLVDACARLHSEHGDRIAKGSEVVGVSAAAAAAVLLVEAQFAPAAVDDRLAIRFEPYAFFQQTGRWLVATHKDQAAEYRSFGEAKAIDPAAAWQAVRMGQAQIGGHEASAAGFASPESMLETMAARPETQVTSLFELISHDPALQSALATEDWRQVASLRAGPGYGALGFDDALAACASVYQRVTHGGGDDDDKPAPRKRKRPTADPA